MNTTGCVDNKMRGCASDSDASNTIVQYWNRAAEAIKYLCVDRRDGKFAEYSRTAVHVIGALLK